MDFAINETKVLTLNSHNLLSIESKRETAVKDKNDSTNFAEDESELFNEAKWNKLNEKILSGPQALSLDVSYPSGTSLYGIPERINSFKLKDTSFSH